MKNPKTITSRSAFFILGLYTAAIVLAWLGINQYILDKSTEFELIEEYKDMAEKDPENAGFHSKLGELYLDLDEQSPGKKYLAKARQHYEKAVELAPGNVDYRYSLAGLSEPEDAVGQYKAILDIDPYEVRANFDLAEYYKSKKEYGPAIVHYENCLKREPTSADVYFAIGEIFEDQAKPDEALKMFVLAKKFDPFIEGLEEKIAGYVK